MAELIQSTADGLWCEAGKFHIDPWRPVPRAVITHAHADHARWGNQQYLTTITGETVLRPRVGPDAAIQAEPYGKQLDFDGVKVSLHPAGHVLGSAQVRVEHRGEVWVVSGDYRTQQDRTAEPFEPVACDTFITESTFGLPIYRWPDPGDVFEQINDWWRTNQQRRRTSILFAYALGKAQRILAGIDANIGPILVHGAVQRVVAAYEAAGVAMPPVLHAEPEAIAAHKGKALVLAPPSANGSPWMRKFNPASTAMASGWMQVRGTRRRRSLDRGFILSDHADWQGLLDTIAATGASRIGVTHGYAATMVRWLTEHGKAAFELPTHFEGEGEEAD